MGKPASLTPMHPAKHAYAPTLADRKPASIAQVAFAVSESQRYTDALIADLRQEVHASDAGNYRDRNHSMRARVTMHLVLMSLGMCIALVIPSAVVIGILATGMPSLVIEITDHYAVLTTAAKRYSRKIRKGK